MRGREETMAEPREAPSTSWSPPSGHKNAGVTRFVMEVLAPSKKKPREGRGGRGGNPPRGWLERRVSTDRIKGVRPTGEPSSGKSSMERSIIQICRNVQ